MRTEAIKRVGRITYDRQANTSTALVTTIDFANWFSVSGRVTGERKFRSLIGPVVDRMVSELNDAGKAVGA